MTSSIINFVKEAKNEVLLQFMMNLSREMLDYLVGFEEVHNKIENALNDIETWKNTKALQLYEHIYPIAILDDSFEINSKEDHAFFSIVSSLYYMIWEIDNIERLNFGDNNVPMLPSDMADVNRETVLSSIDDAIEVVGIDKIISLINEVK